MLKHSDEEFRIYDNDLSGDIAEQYEGFYPALIDYVVKRKHILKIVIENHNIENTKIFKLLEILNKAHSDKVFVKKSSPLFKKEINSLFDNPVNFAIADSSAIRLEESGNADELTRKAFCSFNKPEIVNSLKKVFDAQFETCESVF